MGDLYISHYNYTCVHAYVRTYWNISLTGMLRVPAGQLSFICHEDLTVWEVQPCHSGQWTIKCVMPPGLAELVQLHISNSLCSRRC